MRVSMVVESEGVTTEVTRDYEPNIIQHDREHTLSAVPSLEDVTAAVAAAAVTAHVISHPTTP